MTTRIRFKPTEPLSTGTAIEEDETVAPKPRTQQTSTLTSDANVLPDSTDVQFSGVGPLAEFRLRMGQCDSRNLDSADDNP
ncbi:hypothetical protein [Aureliella helgolandensis]|uniref:hypothetical protein n=1 Tax=Aureliella helgolandensis TaxID=2527968 RepID=UPI0011AA1211|nr:hypothetical protein [Aureliella helgolandensis]